MLAQQNGKAALAALTALLAGSAFGAVPVARFVAPRTADPDPTPTPWHRPPSPPTPVGLGPLSQGTFRAGPLTVETMLSQSKIQQGSNDTVWVDVRLAADFAPEQGPRRPIDFALVLDVSGSMADDNKIGLMKQACLGLEERLGPEDRVSLVSFSTSAQTLFPLQKVGPEYRRAIQQLIARGGTNISAGLELGAAELRRSVRPGAATRLLLLTDGQPNAGDSTPEGLCGLVKKLEQQGISCSTVGLGLDYNAKLLSDMAEAGGGSYSYVDAPQRIAGIYDAELRSLRTLVARGVKVQLEPVAGEILEVIDWQADKAGRGVVINAGDFESARRTKIVARVRVATGVAGTRCGVVRVQVRGEDARSASGFGGSVPLGAEVVPLGEDTLASVIPAAQKDVADARVGDLIEKARTRAERGDTAGARAAFEELKQQRRTVSYEARDGKKIEMSVDEMQQAYENGSSDDRARALLFSKSAASAAAR